MKIETTVKITDDDGNVVERKQLVDVGIAGIDAFNDKAKFLEQFDATEEAIIRANKGATEQAIEAYFEENGEKNAEERESEDKDTGFRDRANSFPGLGRF